MGWSHPDHTTALLVGHLERKKQEVNLSESSSNVDLKKLANREYQRRPLESVSSGWAVPTRATRHSWLLRSRAYAICAMGRSLLIRGQATQPGSARLTPRSAPAARRRGASP